MRRFRSSCTETLSLVGGDMSSPGSTGPNDRQHGRMGAKRVAYGSRACRAKRRRSVRKVISAKGYPCTRRYGIYEDFLRGGGERAVVEYTVSQCQRVQLRQSLDRRAQEHLEFVGGGFGVGGLGAAWLRRLWLEHRTEGRHSNEDDTTHGSFRTLVSLPLLPTLPLLHTLLLPLILPLLVASSPSHDPLA